MDFVTVDGIRLEVRHIATAPGARALAPIVFLHEGLGSVAMWRDWPDQMCAATGRAGIVYSRRGYGRSDPVPNVRSPSFERDGQRGGRLLPDYLHHEAWHVLPALLEICGVSRPVLLGHSDGATIALLYASRHPVSACIVMAPHLFVEDISTQSIMEVRDSFLQGDLRERLARRHADVDGAFWQWNDIWLSAEFRNFDIQQDCARITAPVLAIQGFEDPYGSMRQVDCLADALRAKSALPANARVKLEKLASCGHSPHRDQPERTLAAVSAFLGTLP
jgi:pimeloyl-ACP methyl ester carboxylesterase